jgi:hypothetical protein
MWLWWKEELTRWNQYGIFEKALLVGNLKEEPHKTET